MKMLAVVVVCILSGCATAPSLADIGQAADCGTTAYALNNGYEEANPIFKNASPGVICGVKLAVTQGTRLLPEEQCKVGQMALALSGFSAAIINASVMSGSVLYGIPIVVAMWVFGWDEFRRNAAETCAE